jgi:hypothetical protein
MASDAQSIRDRSFQFACNTVRVALRMQPVPGVRCVVDQLVKSAAAIGANLEEAKADPHERNVFDSWKSRCAKRD